jgi:hypothetical protein
VEAIGAGSGDGSPDTGYGGGGGAYAKSVISVTSGSTVYINVGLGARGSSSTDSWVNSSANSAPSSSTTGVLAKAGKQSGGTSGAGTGGQASLSIGTTVYSGGNGDSIAPSGGGGAAGPGGPGKNGAGLGGGGAGGALSTNATSANNNGGNGPGGASLSPGGLGSSVSNGGGGTNGGGGGGSTISNGGNGSMYVYTAWTVGAINYGPGGGGGGGSNAGGSGGIYGSGSGGSVTGNSPTGANGIVVITYPPPLSTITTTRLTNTGTLFVNGKLDEVTGMTVGTNLLLNLDASKVASIPNNTLTWVDIGPNRYNLSFTTGTQYSTNNSGYYIFNGSSYANASVDFADNPGEITVAGWIYTASTALAEVIAAKCPNLDNGAGWALFFFNPTAGTTNNPNANQPSFFTQQSTSSYNQYFGISPTVTANVWHYVAATLTGGLNGTIKLYLDGVSMTLTNGSLGTVTSASTSTKVTVGGILTQPQYAFLGNIADVQIYNRALSAAEILNNYNAKAALFGLTPTSPAPIMRISTNTVYVNILDERSLSGVGASTVQRLLSTGTLQVRNLVETSL